ncbi:MAG TPA: response regulator transcription factor [Alphaproteobacteria bacterium]|nr:response regulator transcription factor [Alphaproteobacteria bacterium]
MKILVVDDHPIVRAGLVRLLAGDGRFTVSEAATGRDALTMFRGTRPDLVILDLNLPGVSGLEMIRRLRHDDETARILVLSMHDDAIHVVRALEAGAAGYLSKDAPPAEILVAINRIAAGQRYVQQELAQELALLNARPTPHSLDDLSSRELDILRLLGDGSSLQAIADAIGVSYKTVANNCAQIKAKLGVPRTADLIRLAILHGISTKGASPTTAAP